MPSFVVVSNCVYQPCRFAAPRAQQQYDLAQATLVRPRMGTTNLKELPNADGTCLEPPPSLKQNLTFEIRDVALAA
jgi:hypothetical protein